MASDLPSTPNERMKALTLRALGPVGRHAPRDEGGQHFPFIAARGLANDKAGRVERGGEGGERLRLVGDRPGAAVGGVVDDNRRFADLASDDPRGRGEVRHLRLSSDELGLSAGVHRAMAAH